MKLTLLIVSWLALPMILLNAGILPQAGQGYFISASQGSASSNENPAQAVVARVIETSSESVYGSPTALPASVAPLGQSAAVTETLQAFIANIKNGQAAQVVGVYIPQVLALRVAQQPLNNLAYVNTNPGYLTQFSLAAQYGTTGLLAHNYLAGAFFSTLSAGQEVDVIYGDGTLRRYRILILRHFQALNPTSPASNFVDLDNNSGAQISNADLFHQIYVGDRVVFQTCINANGNTSWGRLFVIATPIQ